MFYDTIILKTLEDKWDEIDKTGRDKRSARFFTLSKISSLPLPR